MTIISSLRFLYILGDLANCVPPAPRICYIMPTKLIHAPPPDFQTSLRPWAVYVCVAGNVAFKVSRL